MQIEIALIYVYKCVYNSRHTFIDLHLYSYMYIEPGNFRDVNQDRRNDVMNTYVLTDI
jgi:hypothetical protein